METTKYLIAIPTMDMAHIGFVASLVGMQRVGASRVSFVSNSLIYDARNMLAAEAIDTGADRVLWLDSDMRFAPDLMIRLEEDMDSGLDYVSGLYFKRVIPLAPILCKESVVREDGGKLTGESKTYMDYPKDSLFEIAASGFGAVMCSTKMLKDVYDNYGMPFNPIPGVFGEDYSFCYRARQLGYKLYCDSRIKLGHIGSFTFGEEHYMQKSS